MLKKLLNPPEKLTHHRLREICGGYGASVFAKIRVADVLPIVGSTIGPAEFRFALQAHFDFIVAQDDDTPLFAVEFDGPLHTVAKQVSRDQLKDALCLRFGLPILRINARFLAKKYRGFDLLGWLAEAWFLQESFVGQQQAGFIPEDEPFDPRMIVRVSDSPREFPFWISGPINRKIQKLCSVGKCRDFIPSWIAALDASGEYHALAWVQVNDTSTVYAEAKLRSQQFPLSLAELAAEVAIVDMYRLMQDVMSQNAKAAPTSRLVSLIAIYKRQFRLAAAMTCGTSELTDDWRF